MFYEINQIGAFWRCLMLLMVMFLAWCTPTYALDVTLQWDANTEADLAGYRVYYKAETSGPSYNGTGAVEGNSPIDVGNRTEITLHGLDEDVTYFFAVTAYNTDQLESGFSNQVSISKGAPEQNPVLSNPSVSPATGSPNTNFTYTIHFSDPGGQAPSLARVYIDDDPHAMTHSSGSVNEGDYTFSIKVGVGSHNYYFYFTDSSMNEVRFPAAGTLAGPFVTSNKPDKPKNIRYKNK